MLATTLRSHTPVYVRKGNNIIAGIRCSVPDLRPAPPAHMRHASWSLCEKLHTAILRGHAPEQNNSRLFLQDTATSRRVGGLSGCMNVSFPDPTTKHAHPLVIMPRATFAQQYQSATRAQKIQATTFPTTGKNTKNAKRFGAQEDRRVGGSDAGGSCCKSMMTRLVGVLRLSCWLSGAPLMPFALRTSR